MPGASSSSNSLIELSLLESSPPPPPPLWWLLLFPLRALDVADSLEFPEADGPAAAAPSLVVNIAAAPPDEVDEDREDDEAPLFVDGWWVLDVAALLDEVPFEDDDAEALDEDRCCSWAFSASSFAYFFTYSRTFKKLNFNRKFINFKLML